VAQRRYQYERAFESFLRYRQIPYVAVNEARKAALPDGASLSISSSGEGKRTLKSFDFVIYGSSTNLLVEIKGRKLAATSPTATPRLESWVTLDDIESLRVWESLFGFGFEPAFVFIYRCHSQPPDGLFQEVFEFEGSWYMLRAVLLQAYVERMRTRSPRWRTVHLSRSDFEQVSHPFAPGHMGLTCDAGPKVPVLEPLSA